MYEDATSAAINAAMQNAWLAFEQYKKLSLKKRASFLRAIATGLENAGDELISTAMQETNLPEARLKNEKARTVFQLTSYADACEKGDWLEIRIDTAIPDKTPPKPDIRKMLVPLGPVVVFGSSNFPFAYSTAGGDTATALAAGCPVIVKAHPAHADTSTLVADIINDAALQTQMPDNVFTHLYGASFEVGKALVLHEYTKAVGFTGSYVGGKQLFDWGNQRKEPIPVFAEMGSINPVFLLPEKLKTSTEAIAGMYAGSITLGVGQFCTNPGLIIGIEGESLQLFINTLSKEISNISPAKMLHAGIAKAFNEKRNKAVKQSNVGIVADVANTTGDPLCGAATIATTDAKTFLENKILHEEVFGPYSLVVACKNMNEMIEVAKHLEGQLTATLMATENDIINNDSLIETVKNICGRFILNGVPTGVEVCLSMHHGGPFPSTTDSQYTSVGADAIKRFARPIAFQNWPDSLLPDELKNDNPLKINRTVNNILTVA
ncbi:MAG: aldehyde dehydrogenase (NADP(+)) [Chitinophaga sp.]|nr:aldehyde dehydrogenase (NADP(+)) [Chitinophaga sp.]